MKKIIGYIIRLTAIFISVIFFTMTGVDAAVAANSNPGIISQPITPICNESDKKKYFSDIDIQRYEQELSKFKNGQETREEFITASENLLSKYLQTQSISNTKTE